MSATDYGAASLKRYIVETAKGTTKVHVNSHKDVCSNQVNNYIIILCCGLRRRFAAAHLLRLWVRIPPGAWLSVSCECCVLSGRGVCDELITRAEESYRLWLVIMCDLETS